jgi:hypothetical protein
LSDLDVQQRGLDLAARQAMDPKSWSKWMEIDGKVALQNGDKWRALEFQLKYAPSPSGLTFDKVFSRLNASGGGASDTLVVVTRDIRLTSDHRVEVGSFAGVSSSAGTVTSTAPDQRGTYAIDGYTVELKWDSGKITKTFSRPSRSPRRGSSAASRLRLYSPASSSPRASRRRRRAMGQLVDVYVGRCR